MGSLKCGSYYLGQISILGPLFSETPMLAFKVYGFRGVRGLGFRDSGFRGLGGLGVKGLGKSNLQGFEHVQSILYTISRRL